MQTETWYIAETGEAIDPRHVVHGTDGRLCHKDGRAVAYREDGLGPRSRSINPDEERAKAAPPKKPAAVQRAEARDMKPAETKAGYTTRETKAG